MILRAALGLLFCLLLAFPAQADNQAAIAAYGIGVDVTAADAVSAREQAILRGQRAGIGQVLAMLAPADAARLPALSDAEITDMVADYQVEQEKVSTVRYIGRLTFRFRADAIASYLQRNGIGYSVIPGPRILILPVLGAGGKNMLFEDGNSWREAWAQHPPADGMVGLVLPNGDLPDVSALSGDQAAAGDVGKLQALGARYGVGEIAVAILTPDSAGSALSVKRYGAAGAIGGFDDKVAGDQDSADLAAIDLIAGRLQQDWIEQNRVSSGVEQRLSVEAVIANFAQWTEINRRLAAVGTLRQVDVLYLMRGRAALDLVFVGDRDQLVRALGQQALQLQDSADGRTLLSLAGGASP